MFLVPYILVMIVLELAIIILLFKSLTDSKENSVKILKKKQKPETFNGFYVDR
jgi:hypothetical protein